MLAEAADHAELNELLDGGDEIEVARLLNSATGVVEDDDKDAEELRSLVTSRGRTPPSPLEIALGEYLASPDQNQTRIDKLAKLMFNDARVRKICRLRALKKGVDLNEVDDVIQRTMEVFFAKMLVKMESPEAVYAVVYAVANNVSKEVSRETFATIAGHDSIEALKEKGDDLRESDHADYEEQDRELQVDTRIRISRTTNNVLKGMSGGFFQVNAGIYQECVPLVDFVQGKTTAKEDAEAAAAASLKAAAAPKAPRTLSADQQALVDIIAALEMRNQDFAVHLGIGLPRLSSYIYGRTASVPPEVMAKAREVFAEQSASLANVKKQFSKKMSAIIVDWEKRLGTNTNEELAKLLGVTTMTIHRWRTDETQPDLTALVRYDGQVERLEHMMASAKEEFARKLAKGEA